MRLILLGPPGAGKTMLARRLPGILPDLDDDFASEASEFETLEELRADIGKRVGEAVDERAEQDFRNAVVDAAIAAATIELPDELVAARGAERRC